MSVIAQMWHVNGTLVGPTGQHTNTQGALLHHWTTTPPDWQLHHTVRVVGRAGQGRGKGEGRIPTQQYKRSRFGWTLVKAATAAVL